MKKFLFILFIAALVTATGCSSNSGEQQSKNDTGGQGHQHQSAHGAAGTGTEPVESDSEEYSLDNDGVDEEAFNAALSQFPEEVPQRIITTSVPLTEMLHLLGITPVGVPTSTNRIPADFDTIPRIGSPMQPDLEVVTHLEPDLLLGAESLRSTLEKNLEGIDLATAYLRTDSFDDLKLSIKVLGTYFNRIEEMNAILSKILEKENELMQRAEGKELPSVMLIIGTSDSFMVMSERSYLGSLVKKLGADNIATSALNVSETYSPINMENVVVADPDLILVLASGDHGASEEMFQKEVESNSTWTKLSAYQNDNIHILDYSIFGVTSIRNVEQALTEIADYFYE